MVEFDSYINDPWANLVSVSPGLNQAPNLAGKKGRDGEACQQIYKFIKAPREEILSDDVRRFRSKGTNGAFKDKRKNLIWFLISIIW